MNRKFVIMSSLLGIASLACAQSTGSSGSSQSATTQNAPKTSQQPGLPPGLQTRDQLPSGLQNREQLPPGLQKRVGGTESSGQPAGAGGQFGANSSVTGDQNAVPAIATNAYGPAAQGAFGSTTNQAGQAIAGGTSTNQSGLTPTSDQGARSRTYATNSITRTQTITQDQAYTPGDRTLLTQVKQIVIPVLGTTTTTASSATSPWSPVHFVVNEGVVTLVGYVPQQQQKTIIEQRVQRVPGVVRVINQLEVRESSTTESVGGTGDPQVGGVGSGSYSSSAIPPTSSPVTTQTGSYNESTTGVQSSSGLTPTGSQTNRHYGTNVGSGWTNRYGTNVGSGWTNRYGTNGSSASTNRMGLPPGLRDREQLPPGLEKRDELPPGLDRRQGSPTNSATSGASSQR